MNVRPTELPRLRDDAIRQTVDVTPHVYDEAISRGTQWLAPDMGAGQAGPYLAQAERQRLRMAELFFVSDDMMKLAKAAALSLPEFHLMPDDLPAQYGLMAFNEPIGHVPADEKGRPSYITGVSWGPWHDHPQHYPMGGLWLTWWADTDAMLAHAVEHEGCTEETRRHNRALFGQLVLDNESAVPFTRESIPVQTEDGEHAFTEGKGLTPWIGALKTIWLLMGQPLASVSTAQYDRATARRMQREQRPLDQVRVIALRRPASSGGSGDSSREYHHQWFVRGHWRQQWYPARDVHRPVWIAPHIKGPEGAPLLGGEKVYSLQR